jgi:transcriptional regulator with XRE-family HTH domain
MTRSTHYPRYQRFLDALRAARQTAGVTQTELADRIGNRQVFVSKLERGDRRMDVVDLFEYCEAAGIDVLAFLGELKITLDASPRPRLGKLAINKKRAAPGRGSSKATPRSSRVKT